MTQHTRAGITFYWRTGIESRNEWRKKNWEKVKSQHRDNTRLKREKALIMYGGKCNCCGETEYKFLCFDHINGGGRKDRDGKSSNSFYNSLLNNKREDIQILCHNCNMAKGFYGSCPHKELK